MLLLTPTIYFNMDSFREVISDLVDSNITKIIIIFSSAVKKEAMRIRFYLIDFGIKAEIFELCDSDANALSLLLSQMKYLKPDCIIGLGGGHCMDIAKVVRVLYEDPGTTLRSLAMGTNSQDDERLLKKAMIHRRGTLIKKLICIPTTCGSGSEVTSTAVLRNDDGRQVVVSGIAFLPDISIIDSNFILSIPKFIASITGIRALLHGLESYISNYSSDYSSCMAFEALSILFSKLKNSIVNKNINLLQEIHKSASIAGIAIAATDVGLGTIIARSISEVFLLPHGLIDSIVIKYVLIFNIKRSEEIKKIVADLSVRLGLSNTSDSKLSQIQALLNEIDKIKSSLFLPESLNSIPTTLLFYKSQGWFEPNKDPLDNLYLQTKWNEDSEILKDEEISQQFVPNDHILKTIPILTKENIISNLNLFTFQNNLQRMISRALNDGAILTNPVKVTQEDLETIFYDIWNGNPIKI